MMRISDVQGTRKQAGCECSTQESKFSHSSALHHCSKVTNMCMFLVPLCMYSICQKSINYFNQIQLEAQRKKVCHVFVSPLLKRNRCLLLLLS